MTDCCWTAVCHYSCRKIDQCYGEDTMTESQNQSIEFMIQRLMSSTPHSSVREGASSLLLVSILEASCYRFKWICSRTFFYYFHVFNSSTGETSRNVPPSLALLYSLRSVPPSLALLYCPRNVLPSLVLLYCLRSVLPSLALQYCPTMRH